VTDSLRAATLSIEGGVGVIRIDNPPVNALSAAVLVALESCLAEARGVAGVTGLVIIGARDVFVAGADVSRLERMAAGAPLDEPGVPRLPELLRSIEESALPVVAAIDGFALGGGLELALACHARVGTPEAKLGLPELALGLIPGAGGTQRLPRLAGLEAAVEMMLSSRPVAGARAKELGILDAVVPQGELLLRARSLALEIARGLRPKRVSLSESQRLPAEDERSALLSRARADAARRFPHVSHASACLDAIEHGIEAGGDAGLVRERELFLAALGSEAARGLLHLFFAERAAAKVPGIELSEDSSGELAVIGVVGGGTMGSGIATALLDAGLDVVLVETSPELAARARGRIEKNVERAVEKGRLDAERARETLARLETVSALSALARADLVIEAASEDLALKRRIFAELRELTHPHVPLCSNTSTIDIGELGTGAGLEERLVGLHFFSPAHVMKLVEVVRAAESGKAALASALRLVKRMKKTAVTVRSCPGFLVNRVFMPYSQLTGFLIDRGIDPYRIDRALVAFGMPMGPNRMSDLAGVDVGVAAGNVLDAAYPNRVYRSALRRLLFEAGRLGEKSGRGHYLYESGRALPDPELSEFVARARALAGSPTSIELSDQEIAELVLFGVVNEACRVVEERVVLRPSDVDVAATLGMGFPSFRGGPLKWADGLGAERVSGALGAWHARFGHPIFEPAHYLVERARRGASLFEA